MIYEDRLKLNDSQTYLLSKDKISKNSWDVFMKIVESYDIENYLFGELRKKANERGYLTQEEFMVICLWKSVRPKKLFEKNTPEKIKKITQKSFSSTNDLEKIEILRELSGVEIPTASAILCVYNPKKYGVIDIRALEVLKVVNKINRPTLTVQKIGLNTIIV